MPDSFTPVNGNGYILTRPRINSLLAKAAGTPLVIVCASAGYGKTCAINSFVQEYNAISTYVRLSAYDNNYSRFWENFSHTVSYDNAEFIKKLAGIGFPENDTGVEKYFSLLNGYIEPDKKYITVFDDFHLIHNNSVIRFIEKTVQMPFPNITTILISRVTPEMSIIELENKKIVTTVNENDLRFTRTEIRDYLKGLGVTSDTQAVNTILKDSKGWAFVVDMAGISMKKARGYENYALSALMPNIFNWIETETFLLLSVQLQNFLIRLSLIDHLSAELVNMLAKSPATVDEMGSVNSYIRYEKNMNAYLIHHIFWEFLSLKQDSLSDQDKLETYSTAGKWCEDNGYKMDAITYYEKIGDYGSILRIHYSLNMQLPAAAAQFLSKIYEKPPLEDLEKNPLFPVMRLNLIMSLNRIDEALDVAEGYIKKYEVMPLSESIVRQLTSVAIAKCICLFIKAPFSDSYDFDIAFAEMEGYYNRKPYPMPCTRSSQNIGPWFSMVGTGRKGAMEEYIAVLGRAVPHMAKVMNGCMAGLDILTAGELYYSKGDMKNAEITFVRGLAVARANKQYDFQCRVLFYLMRIGFFLGDYERVQEALSSLESLLDETGYLISETAYDITMGWYHIFIGEPEQMADWLKGDFDYDAAGFFLENLENIIKTRYYVLKGRWRELLEYLKYRRGKEAIFYGKLGIKILESLCYYNLKDKEAAFGAFTEAYELSESNQLITAFIEYGRYMRTLTIAAMKDRSCKISQEWLKMIKSKSETFSKYRLQVVAEYKAKNGITDEVNLSIREREVLVELYKGLSNQDIAIRQDLSITWVKQIINNIRVKLGAETAVDIVRIATERKMV